MKLLALLLCFFIIQTGSAELPPEPDYRFLFIIDNSFSMRGKKEAIVRTVRDLVATGFHGQIQEGERFGIWTFNNKDQSRRFPSQVWNASEYQLLAEIAAQFLQTLRFEGKTDLLPAFLELNRYTTENRTMLAFVLCDGDQGIVGTPFDGEVNRIFTEHARKLDRAKKPFLLILNYHRGLATAARVFSGSGVIELPQIIREPLPASSAPELAPHELASSPAPSAAQQQPSPTETPVERTVGSTAPKAPTEVREPQTQTESADVPLPPAANLAPPPLALQLPEERALPPETLPPPVPAALSAPDQASRPGSIVPQETFPVQSNTPAQPAASTSLVHATPSLASTGFSESRNVELPNRMPAHTAIIPPPEPVPKWPFLAAGIGVALLFFYWLRLRDRKPPSSLISQSFDR